MTAERLFALVLAAGTAAVLVAGEFFFMCALLGINFKGDDR